MCEIVIVIVIVKLPLRSFWCFIVNFELCFTPFSSVSAVDFEQVNASWVCQLSLSDNLCQRLLPTDIHLLKPSQYSQNKKSSELCSGVIKII